MNAPALQLRTEMMSPVMVTQLQNSLDHNNAFAADE